MGYYVAQGKKGANCYHCLEQHTALRRGEGKAGHKEPAAYAVIPCLKLKNRQNPSMVMGVKSGLVFGEGVMTGPGSAEPLGWDCAVSDPGGAYAVCIRPKPSSWTPKIQEACMYMRI